MNTSDRRAINRLFHKLSVMEQICPPLDTEADAVIREQVAQNPVSLYYMVQTIIIQEKSLGTAKARIKQLESALLSGAQQSGRGRFGDGRHRAPLPASVPAVGQFSRQSLSRESMREGVMRARNARIIAGVARAAAGVVGGIFLGTVIASMFEGDETDTSERAGEDAEGAEPVDGRVSDLDDFGV